ncbi:MAG TPA: DUF4349 domain-containing protein [Polyangiaceae bacterium]|nr:DUF4349 domain-containing protein [Polyangiaceae bacterium]
MPPPIAPAAPGAVASPSSLPKTSRKVIRNAELSIESATPAVAESKVSSLIERLGGYVAGAERLVTADEGQRSQATVKLSLRVPAERLDEALRDIKRLGGGAETEKISSEDVTDEYIDVEARISNQRHLEQQLVTILAQVTTVDNALKVHQELTAVRTEIDRLEGRKRFLDTESALAKISLSIAPLSPVVNASSTEFGVAVRRAASDSVAVAAGVVTFSIRAVGVLAPLGLLFGLPTAGVWFGLRRRTRKLASAAAA